MSETPGHDHPDNVDPIPQWAWGITAMRPIDPDDLGERWLFLTPMMFTLRLSVGDRTGYSEFWDYENKAGACAAYRTWPDGMWIPPAHDWTRHLDPATGQMERRGGQPPDGETGHRP